MPKTTKIIIASVVILLLIAGGVLIFVFGRKTPPTQKAELEVWGVFDSSDVFKPLIDKFNGQYPQTTINYYKKNYETYEKDLLEAMAAGQGPDIFMIHHTWLSNYQDKIKPMPQGMMSLRELKDEFVDVAVYDFSREDSIYALPLNIDTLALFYNKDIFNTAAIAQPPQTWEEFLTDVEKLTIRDEKGNIIRAGAAVGTARNINRSTDIISLLMLQSGAKMTNEEGTAATFSNSVTLGEEVFYPGERALEFYTDFANPLKAVYTWNDRMHYSIDAFYEGKTAMMFNYSYNIPTIKAKSPYLNFAVGEMPQIDKVNKVNYANYWGLTVSKNSKDFEPAWQFIRWLSKKENLQQYLELSGRPTPRRDLVTWQMNDPELGVFAQQSLSAYSWYQVDNLTIEQILADMIESVVLGQSTIKEAVNKAASDITLLMRD